MIDLTSKDDNKIKLKKTDGYWLYDESGNRFLDITSGGMTFTLGYNNKRIIQSMSDSLSKVSRCHTPLGYITDEIEEMASFLCKSGEWGGYVWSVTGTGAMEAGIEILDKYWEILGEYRPYIISFSKGWHGTTALTKPMSGFFPTNNSRSILIDHPIWIDQEGQEPEEASALFELRELLESRSDIGAVIINPAPWFNGVNVWSHTFFKELDKLRKEFRFLLISDDIASCWGKSKAFHSHTTIFPDGIKPDISCLGKGITAGYAPLSAAVVSEEIKDLVQKKVFYGHTFHPYVAGIAAMKTTTDIILEENLLEKAQIIENQLVDIGNKLKKENIIDSFRAFGLNASYDIKKEANPSNLNLLGVKTRFYGMSKTLGALPTVRICAPLIADEEYFGLMEELLRDILQ
jgi:adenosylmethionine-8-amino-7-oxononanoate aminotransferase